MPSRQLRLGLACVVLAGLIGGAGCGRSERAPFRIGVLAECTGLVAETHDWTLAGAELPLLLRGGKLAGKGPAGGVRGTKVAGTGVELVEGCAESGVYGVLITAVRQLVEVDRVDAVVGAMGWTDSVVFREIARRYPTVPFLIAGSFVREATAHTPAANVYRFDADVEQAHAGLATYAYRTLGWRRAAVVSEDLPNGWGAVAAFAAEFCALGGSVERVWTPAFGAPGPLIKQVPAAVDGVLVVAAYGYGSPIAFIRAYLALHPDSAKTLLFSLWLNPAFEQAAYAKLWPDLRGVAGRLAGLPDPSSASNTAYRRAFARAFPGLPPGLATSLFVQPYYTAVDALLHALESTGGEPGADRRRLRSALSSLRFDTPVGPVRLDHNRQAVVPATVVRLTGSVPGPATFEPVLRISAVDEMLGGLLAPASSPTHGHDCPRAAPPPWAR